MSVYTCVCVCVSIHVYVSVCEWWPCLEVGCSNEPGLMIIGGPGVPGRGSPSHGRGFGRKIWIASLFRSDQPGNCEHIFLNFSLWKYFSGFFPVKMRTMNGHFFIFLFFCGTHFDTNPSPGHSFFLTFFFWACSFLDQNVPFFLHPSSQIKCFPSSY